MIAYLKGRLLTKKINYLIILVNGIGYRVNIGLNVLEKIGPEKTNIALFVYQAVRENSVELFGFISLEELELFELLISVSGVGPKVGQNIIANCPVLQLRSAIIENEPAVFDKIPRIGTKLAQKIILELHSKFSKDETILKIPDQQNMEIVAALTGFGYSAKEINQAINDLPEKISKVEDKLKWVLKKLGQ